METIHAHKSLLVLVPSLLLLSSLYGIYANITALKAITRKTQLRKTYSCTICQLVAGLVICMICAPLRILTLLLAYFEINVSYLCDTFLFLERTCEFITLACTAAIALGRCRNIVAKCRNITIRRLPTQLMLIALVMPIPFYFTLVYMAHTGSSHDLVYQSCTQIFTSEDPMGTDVIRFVQPLVFFATLLVLVGSYLTGAVMLQKKSLEISPAPLQAAAAQLPLQPASPQVTQSSPRSQQSLSAMTWTSNSGSPLTNTNPNSPSTHSVKSISATLGMYDSPLHLPISSNSEKDSVTTWPSVFSPACFHTSTRDSEVTWPSIPGSTSDYGQSWQRDSGISSEGASVLAGASHRRATPWFTPLTDKAIEKDLFESGRPASKKASVCSVSSNTSAHGQGHSSHGQYSTIGKALQRISRVSLFSIDTIPESASPPLEDEKVLMNVNQLRPLRHTRRSAGNVWADPDVTSETLFGSSILLPKRAAPRLSQLGYLSTGENTSVSSTHNIKTGEKKHKRRKHKNKAFRREISRGSIGGHSTVSNCTTASEMTAASLNSEQDCDKLGSQQKLGEVTSIANSEKSFTISHLGSQQSLPNNDPEEEPGKEVLEASASGATGGATRIIADAASTLSPIQQQEIKQCLVMPQISRKKTGGCYPLNYTASRMSPSRISGGSGASGTSIDSSQSKKKYQKCSGLSPGGSQRSSCVSSASARTSSSSINAKGKSKMERSSDFSTVDERSAMGCRTSRLFQHSQATRSCPPATQNYVEAWESLCSRSVSEIQPHPHLAQSLIDLPHLAQVNDIFPPRIDSYFHSFRLPKNVKSSSTQTEAHFFSNIDPKMPQIRIIRPSLPEPARPGNLQPVVRNKWVIPRMKSSRRRQRRSEAPELESTLASPISHQSLAPPGADILSRGSVATVLTFSMNNSSATDIGAIRVLKRSAILISVVVLSFLAVSVLQLASSSIRKQTFINVYLIFSALEYWNFALNPYLYVFTNTVLMRNLRRSQNNR